MHMKDSHLIFFILTLYVYEEIDTVDDCLTIVLQQRIIT